MTQDLSPEAKAELSGWARMEVAQVFQVGELPRQAWQQGVGEWTGARRLWPMG